MHFFFSEEQEQWRVAVREFVRRECPPEYARACDRGGRGDLCESPIGGQPAGGA